MVYVFIMHIVYECPLMRRGQGVALDYMITIPSE